MMPTNKTIYVLIHGAWHASWCWQYVTPLLIQQGHQVIAPDLPGHGQHFMNFKDINLTTYVDYITQLIMPLATPVVLVGHSMAGVIISQIAENIPQHIKKLIYISAFIPDHNGSLIQAVQKSESPGLSPVLAINYKKNEIILKKTSVTKNLLFNCCNQERATLALSLLHNEPWQPFIDNVTLSNEKFGKIKKLYIECLQDNVITPQDQQRMYKKNNCDVICINTDHSPFFSAVDKLVNAIKNN